MTVRKYVLLGLFVLLLPVLGYVWFARGSPGKSLPRLESPWATEEEWLVDQVARDLAEMAVFARSGRGPATVTVTVEVEEKNAGTGVWTVSARMPGAPPVQQTLKTDASVWSPVEWQHWAAALLVAQRLSPATDPSPSHEILLSRLLEARTPELEEQNQLVSQALESRMTDPRNHEDAALVLGAFALREAAQAFSDLRPVLCRMTAHLAFARALRSGAEPEPTGQYATALLRTLAGRGAEARTDLESLARDAPPDTPRAGWLRVLRLRLTQDWRLLAPGEGTFLERLEHFRALEETLGVIGALRKLGGKEDPSPTWMQIAVKNSDVGTGNRFCDKALEFTLLQAAEIFALARGRRPNDDELLEALNEPAERFVSKVGPRVIAWGTWAAMFERHLCFLVRRREEHYRNALGLKNEADTLSRESGQRFGRLVQYPLVATTVAFENKLPVNRLDDAITLVIRRPELAPVICWRALTQLSHTQAVRRSAPNRYAWFSTWCPRNTSYDFPGRYYWMQERPDPKPELEVLNRVSPDDYEIAYIWLRLLLQHKPPPRKLGPELFGARMEYDLRAMWYAADFATDDDLDRQRSIRTRMCEITPLSCIDLGYFLVERGEDEAAASAYERAVAEADNRVWVSNSCRWLVGYYLSHGRRDRAREIAEMAGEVNSYGGLLTLASYLEKTGDFTGAESTMVAAAERYPDTDNLVERLGFYHRLGHVRGIAAYKRKFDDAARSTFPRGLEPVTLESLSGPLNDGVVVLKSNARLRRAGIRGGEIIVAFDGWRVRTQAQYAAIREFDDSPDVRWIVWQGSKYIEVKLRSPDRYFDFEIRTFARAN